MQKKQSDGVISASLLFVIVIWGINNAGTKYMVNYWPPIFVGGARCLGAAAALFALLRWTNWLGKPRKLSRELNRKLWWNCGGSMAVYVLTFNWAIRAIPASHVALYMGASPVWALLWEGWPKRDWKSAQRYGATALAFSGVVVLLWPGLMGHTGHLWGEMLGLASGMLWANYGRQCRAVGTDLSGAEITAHSFWRGGVLVAPFMVLDMVATPIHLRNDLVALLVYSILISGVMGFVLWNNALKQWKTSEVYLFGNLIPLSTMICAHFMVHEAITRTFWLAMILIAAGVTLGQTNYAKLIRRKPDQGY